MLPIVGTSVSQSSSSLKTQDSSRSMSSTEIGYGKRLRDEVSERVLEYMWHIVY